MTVEAGKPNQPGANALAKPETGMTIDDRSPIQILRTWFKPRSDNRDEAFRETTIRAVSAIMVVISILSLIASVVVFGNRFAPVSYPTILTLWFILSLASAYAVVRRRILLAGWFLIAAVLETSYGAILISGYYTEIAASAFMVSVLMTGLVLPRNVLIPQSLVIIAVYTVTAFVQYTGMSAEIISRVESPLEFSINFAVLVLMQALLLRQLRGEFDDRLAAMAESIKQTEAAKLEADRANKAKSQFLANVSHELRTPLNAINGYIEIMLGGMAGTFTEKQTQLQQYIHSNAQRLLLLINDILDLAKIESGRIEVIATLISPRKVVDESINTMQSLAQKKNITLTAHYTDEVPEQVLCDVNKVQQILVNLVGNAIKFTHQGGVTVEVGSSDKSNWTITVQDTGKGMPQEAVNYIFEMFRQVDGTDAREQAGTGLGLAITKGLIDRMGGTIKVETTLGAGSSFIVTLPRLAPDVKKESTKEMVIPSKQPQLN
jgi:signal transduction histidine kinase